MEKPQPFIHWERGPLVEGYSYRFPVYDWGVLVFGRLVIPTYMVVTAYLLFLIPAFVVSMVFASQYEQVTTIDPYLPFLIVLGVGAVPLAIWGIRVVVSKILEQIEWRGPR